MNECGIFADRWISKEINILCGLFLLFVRHLKTQGELLKHCLYVPDRKQHFRRYGTGCSSKFSTRECWIAIKCIRSLTRIMRTHATSARTLSLMFERVLVCARLPLALYLGTCCAGHWRHHFVLLFVWAKLEDQPSSSSLGGTITDIIQVEADKLNQA